MKQCFAYIRVSTVRQSERGVSLQEQRDTIERYSGRNAISIAGWFEETETAAKRGRPVFTKMLRLLKARKADGVIIHKIDRSARNLRDWADLGELIDAGVEVHFCHESLDLHTRGGRLSADIQAVVAADYVRNLREETRKGFYGRLKQGLYPLPAPLGYRDRGKGYPKDIDHDTAPLVRQAFELYGSGRYTLKTLRAELHRRGLRNRRGGRVSVSGLSVLLNNPFYIGLMRIRRTAETFPGAHTPLIAPALFERVQAILAGRNVVRTRRHEFLFRRMLRCRLCGGSLIGELQKGHVYYRCHNRHQPPTSVTEERVEQRIGEALKPIEIGPREAAELLDHVSRIRQNWMVEREKTTDAIKLSLRQTQARLDRLTDAYLDRLLDKAAFDERRAALLLEKRSREHQLATIEASPHAVPDRIAHFVELAKGLYLSYLSALPDQKRDLLNLATSNRSVSGKNVYIALRTPFLELANRLNLANGAPQRDRYRTQIGRLFDFLVTHFGEKSEELMDKFEDQRAT